MCTDLNFGRVIDFAKAKRMLTRHRDIIKKETFFAINPVYEDSEEYIKTLKTKNMFVFEKKCFEELLKNDANYVVITLGAHDETKTFPINCEDREFKKGSFTLMCVAYKGKPDASGKLKVIIPVNENPIYEYPPHYDKEDFIDIHNPIIGDIKSIPLIEENKDGSIEFF